MERGTSATISMFGKWFTVLFSKDASGAYTRASADIGEAKNHVITSSTTKSLDMKMTVPEVP